MMSFWQNFWWLVRRLFIGMAFITAIAIITPFTPIFANISVFLLDSFSFLTIKDADKPSTLVVLGGGLTKKNGEIILNHYSQSRADKAISYYQTTPIIIITSGVESPWLQDYLRSKLQHSTPPIIISDNASMNTCENAVFTTKLLEHHELPKSIYLITDRYHMARARRQFARMGINTLPQPAPLSIPLTWTNTKNNLVHSRRAMYEIAALARDVFRPQNNCRTSNQISLKEISMPRRKAKIFF